MSQKFIYTVTITGADDCTDIGALVEISTRYPFVEWGILHSSSNIRSGTPRYPTSDWITSLKGYADKAKFALHLCGLVARQMALGRPELDSIKQWLPFFGRVQLNLGTFLYSVTAEEIMNGIKLSELTPENVIVQLGGRAANCDLAALPVSYLFDTSGGTGVLPTGWPVVPNTRFGYAGGLKPENVEAEVVKMSHRTAYPVWIDVESGVRSGVGDDSVFDLAKVVDFIKKVEPFVLK